MAQYQDNVAKWSDMSTRRLLFQWTSTIKYSTKWISSSFPLNVICSRHDMAEKLLLFSQVNNSFLHKKRDVPEDLIFSRIYFDYIFIVTWTYVFIIGCHLLSKLSCMSRDPFRINLYESQPKRIRTEMILIGFEFMAHQSYGVTPSLLFLLQIFC